MAKKKYVINVDDFCQELGLEILNCPKSTITLSETGINRPGLQLHGYYEYFDEKRIQIVGKVEISYLRGLKPEKRKERIDEFFKHDFPCLIVCWDLDDADIFLEAAKKYNRNLFRAKEHTSDFVYHIMDFIDLVTAPLVSLHGVLVEVHGVGVLITGASGIGKSETAIELIQRGSNLIADDMVDIRCYHNRTLIGTAPELLRYFMEVRGIGIINVSQLYGAKSVKQANEVDMMIRLENWNDKTPYDRLGLDEETINILGVEVPLVTVPVSSGRNLAIIIETAAINSRMKKLGIHSAEIFCNSVTQNNQEIYEKNLSRLSDAEENPEEELNLKEREREEKLANEDETLVDSEIYNDLKDSNS